MALEDLSKIEQEALQLYMEYFNAWASHGRSPTPEELVTIDDFFKYPETFHIATVETGWHVLHVLSAGTGDDGGPAILYIWEAIQPDPNDTHITAIAQEFDTIIGFFYNEDDEAVKDGKVNWPDTP